MDDRHSPLKSASRLTGPSAVESRGNDAGVRTTVRRTSLSVLAFRERLSRINELGVLLAAAAIAVLKLG